MKTHDEKTVATVRDPSHHRGALVRIMMGQINIVHDGEYLIQV